MASSARAAIALALALAPAFACGYRAVDLEELAITATPPMVDQRIHLPLYLIRDSARIPEHMRASAPGGPSVDVYNVRTFVERDLRVALGSIFDSVTVVDPTAQVPAGERLVGFVSIDELGLAYASAANKSWVGTMRFSLEIRLPGAPTYVYRFAGTANGAVTLTDKRRTDEVFASTFASAIQRVLDGLARSGVAGRLQKVG
ncbi:MAG: hypothetical protein KC420_02515 [Myxococcales bacterium]|nr:hypothetical protein [Myxococcales bacterium]MCB9569186.1 hypothetical protein [Myxococcales bacterium]MCB9706055.1 hypothetical protein [Myxococcales bacterium]